MSRIGPASEPSDGTTDDDFGKSKLDMNVMAVCGGDPNREGTTTNPFGRSSRITRTPTKKCRSLSLPDCQGEKHDAQGDKAQCGIADIGVPVMDRFKRKRDKGSPNDGKEESKKGRCNMEEKYRKILERVQSTVTTMNRIVGENANTKKEMREATVRLKYMIEQLMSRNVQDWMDESLKLAEKARTTGNGEGRERASSITVSCSGTQTGMGEPETDAREVIGTGGPSVANAATQTIEEDEESSAGLQSRVENAADYASCWNVSGEENWPEGSYRRTKMAGGHPTADMDRVIVLDAQGGVRGRFLKRLVEQQPYVGHILNDGKPIAGELAYVISGGHIITESGNKTSAEERYTFLVGVQDGWEGRSTEEDADTAKKLHGVLCRLRDLAEMEGRKRLGVTFADLEGQDSSMVRLRKMMECVFRGTDIEITVYVGNRNQMKSSQGARPTPASEATPSGEWRTQGSGRGRRLKTKTVDVKVGDKREDTYAETLRNMRAKINIDDMGLRVQSIRRTNTGNVRLKVMERKEGAGLALKAAVEKELGEGVKADIWGDQRHIMVRDLDVVTTVEEVKAAICDAVGTVLGSRREDIVVNSIRKSLKGDTQVATVTVEKEVAREVLKLRRIKVGWFRCRVSEKVQPTRCYRCQQYGHYAVDCKGDSMRARCLKCGDEGHFARECKNEANCYLCEEKGHRADTMACPKYRALVKDSREKRERGTAR